MKAGKAHYPVCTAEVLCKIMSTLSCVSYKWNPHQPVCILGFISFWATVITEWIKRYLHSIILCLLLIEQCIVEERCGLWNWPKGYQRYLSLSLCNKIFLNKYPIKAAFFTNLKDRWRDASQTTVFLLIETRYDLENTIWHRINRCEPLLVLIVRESVHKRQFRLCVNVVDRSERGRTEALVFSYRESNRRAFGRVSGRIGMALKYSMACDGSPRRHR